MKANDVNSSAAVVPIEPTCTVPAPAFKVRVLKLPETASTLAVVILPAMAEPQYQHGGFVGVRVSILPLQTAKRVMVRAQAVLQVKCQD